jgi:hypothetical protein
VDAGQAIFGSALKLLLRVEQVLNSAAALSNIELGTTLALVA